jgi:hypothetical protein
VKQKADNRQAECAQNWPQDLSTILLRLAEGMLQSDKSAIMPTAKIMKFAQGTSRVTGNLAKTMTQSRNPVPIAGSDGSGDDAGSLTRST